MKAITKPIYSCRNFPVKTLDDVDRIRASTNKNSKKYTKQYLNILCSFDIEASNIPEIKQSILYHWQVFFDGIGYVTGRYWNDFKILITRIRKQLNGNETLVIFVHNLSYEFSFLQGQFDFQPKDVFAVDSRKILSADLTSNNGLGNIEFRCSYLQTNMGLSLFLEEYEAEDSKLANFDYDKIRLSSDTLDDEEIEYCLHDVSGLVQAMKNRMSANNDTITTLPKTSTGYPRAAIKAVLPRPHIKKLITDLQMSPSEYHLCRWAFRGGNTHANRHWIGGMTPNIIKNVHSWDIASCYPYAILTRKFPITEFIEWVVKDESELLNLLKAETKACLMYVKFNNIRLKDNNWGCPYISLGDKMFFSDVDVHSNGQYDNGRILSAEYIRMAITDIDYKIIREEYDYDSMEIEYLYVADYGYIPEDIKDIIREYFTKKTKLKGVLGSESLYALNKALLNAIYGLMAQNPIKEQTKFNTDGNGFDRFTKENLNYVVYEDDNEEDVAKEYAQRIFNKLSAHYTTLSLPYQWGVWTTAWSRRELEDMLRIIHNHYSPYKCFFVYCDTDSCKFFDLYDVCRADIEAYNEIRKQEAIKHRAYAENSKGVVQYMGVFDYEGQSKKFMTLGAKRYVCEYEENGKSYLSLTVAGVSKIEGAIELSVMGGLSAFKDGMVFGTHDLPEYVIFGGHGYISSEFPEIRENVYLASTEFQRIKEEQGIKKAKELFNSPEYKKKGWDKYRKGIIVKPHKSNAGGTVSYYNDKETVLDKDIVLADGHILPKGMIIPPNVYIESTTKEINRNKELLDLNMVCTLALEYLRTHNNINAEMALLNQMEVEYND